MVSGGFFLLMMVSARYQLQCSCLRRIVRLLRHRWRNVLSSRVSIPARGLRRELSRRSIPIHQREQGVRLRPHHQLPALMQLCLRSPPPPAGPLELPSHDDSDSEDSCDEEYDSKLGIVVEPHPRYFPYIIARRLKRARSVGIIDDWCRSISFSPEAYRVLPICIERIERERVRRGGTRFKVGITHCPTWRFVAAPYAYCRDAPPWGTMNVLWVSNCVDQGQQLETDLITHFKLAKTLGRYNINPGGENPPRVAPVFVYCVFGFGPYGGSRDAHAYMAARARRVGNKRSRR